MNIKNFTFKDVTKAEDGFTIFKNSYWACLNGDPQQALFFKNIFPQCNKNKDLVDRFYGKGLEGVNIETVFLETAYAKELK